MSASFSNQYMSIIGEETRAKSPKAKQWVLIKKDNIQLKLLESGEFQIVQNGTAFSQETAEFQKKVAILVKKHLGTSKVYYAQQLVQFLSARNADANEVPIYYKKIIDDVTKLAGYI